MNKEEYKIDVQTAISLLVDEDDIHTFVQGGPALIGCDHPRENIIKILNEYKDYIEITGKFARSMKHGIAVKRESGFLFIKTREDVDWSVYD